MAEFLPFKGTRYDPKKVKLAEVVAPPYDVISPEQRDAYYDLEEHNVIRLELNRDEDPYTSSKNFFDTWKADGTLIRDEKPAFYVYYQTFKTPGGREVTREGVLGRLKLTPYSEKQVLPHERTLAGPKRDRLKLLETVQTNLSPIFGLINDPARLFDHMLEVAAVNPAVADIDEALPNGESVRHVMWKLTDPTAVSHIQKIVESQPVIIADGHHRYETSLAYAQAHPELPGASHILIFIANIHGDGTVILPTHRMLHSMPDFNQFRFIEDLRSAFDVEIVANRASGIEKLESQPMAITLVEFPEEPRWGLVSARSNEGLAPLQKLAPYRLQEEILKRFAGLTQQAIDDKTNLFYPHTLKEVDELTSSSQVDATFLLRPVSPQETGEVVEAGDFMPQKSTFFYPKLLTGLVFHEFGVQ